MKVVSDCSPITNLVAIDRLHLLHSLHHEIIIAEAVCRELSVSHPELFSGVTSTLPWITVQQVSDRSEVTMLLADLDIGEAETLVLMKEVQADLSLIDERRARDKAASHGFRYTGLVGVLLEAKAKGWIDSVKPILDELIEKAGFWVREPLYIRILQTAGE